MVRFTVKTSDLVRELKQLAGIAARETSIPILGNVLIEAELDGLLRLTATDMDISLQASCTAQVLEEGAVTVPARKLLSYVKALDSPDVEIVEQSNHWIGVQSGRSRARIAGMAREAFPILPVLPSGSAWEISLGELGSMIALTGFAVSREESRFTLGAALFQLNESRGLMVGTDGHRLAFLSGKGSIRGGELDTLLPIKALGELRKLAAEADPEIRVRIAEDPNNLFFEIGGRQLTTRKMTGNFPQYGRVLPKELPLSAVVDRVELLAAVERVAKFADANSSSIRIRVASTGELVLSARVAELGESEEAVPADYSGRDLEIAFNANYLVDFLRVVSESRVTFLLKDSQSAGEWRPTEGDLAASYRYVLMPMRI